MAKKKKTTEEQPKAKEQKTKRELQAMARERLGCAVPVRQRRQRRLVLSDHRGPGVKFWDTSAAGEFARRGATPAL